MMKLLLIEDEPGLSRSISEFLGSRGFIVEEAFNLFDGEDKILSTTYDLVILDIMLPDGNGLDLLKILKAEQPETGVLIISAKNALDDRIRGLDLGADDYITKPFHLSELNARVNAIIRRRVFKGNDKLTFGEITIIPAEQQVTVNQQKLPLTGKEFDLLVYFVTNKERVVTKSAIAEHLWGDQIDFAGNYDFIYTHIKNLRKKIHEASGNDYLKTIYGLGYKFSEG